jgi:F420-non-reducing hydrogenase iron-sulfur subunit
VQLRRSRHGRHLPHPISTQCPGYPRQLQCILRALKLNADGVLIAGCHFGDCHYISGNYQTSRRVALLKEYLKEIGLEPERLRLEWISAAEGHKFAETMKAFVNEIKLLGPNPLANGGPE